MRARPAPSEQDVRPFENSGAPPDHAGRDGAREVAPVGGVPLGGLESAELEALIAGAPDGVAVINEAGTIVYANRTLERMFAYEPGSLAGRSIEVLIPEHLREVHRHHRAHFEQRPELRPMGVGLTLLGRRSDGVEVPVDVSLSPTSLGSGLHVTAFVREISERLHAEEAVRASEERFRLLVETVADHALYVVDPGGRVSSWNRGAERLTGYRADEILGESTARLYTEEDRAAGLPALALARAARDGHYSAEGWRVRRDGSRFRARTFVEALRGGQGELRGFAKVTRDITDLYSRIAIADLMAAILSEASTTEVLERVSRYACSIVDGRAAWVVAPLAPLAPLALLASHGQHLAGRVQGDFSDDEAVLSTMRENRPIAVEHLVGAASSPDEQTLASFGPALYVPLRSGEEVLGVLTVVRKAGDQSFTEGETELLMLFAEQAALALHTSQLREEVDRLRLSDERERIARDLHDTVIQRLFAAGMSLQAALPLATSPEMRARVDQAIGDLDDTIRSIRTTIFDLRPTPLPAGTDARQKILGLTREAARGLGFEPEVRFSGAVDAQVTEEILAELLPTLREALSNVARHAHASRVEVVVRVTSELLLVVRDDGVGIDSPPVASSGLANIEERARRLGGESRLERLAEGGCGLYWRVPLHP